MSCNYFSYWSYKLCLHLLYFIFVIEFFVKFRLFFTKNFLKMTIARIIRWTSFLLILYYFFKVTLNPSFPQQKLLTLISYSTHSHIKVSTLSVKFKHQSHLKIIVGTFHTNAPQKDTRVDRENQMTLTSAIFCKAGAAMNTTYGENSAVRNTFSACGSTSRMAILPSWWILRIVSNLVPYIASSCVPVNIFIK